MQRARGDTRSLVAVGERGQLEVVLGAECGLLLV